jgi:hypothetical protein
MTAANTQRLRALGAVTVVGLLVWAAGAASTESILAAFTIVVAVGLFLVPKFALAVIGVFLMVQPALVNLAGGADAPLGLALHRLHQAFAVAAVVRVAMFLSWDRVVPRLRAWLWLTIAFLALGVVSGVIQGVPLPIIALGGFLAVKFPLFLLLALTISWDERDCERIMRAALWLGPILVVSGVIIGMLPPDVQDIFVDHTADTESYAREQLAAMQGIFSHPGVFGWAVAASGCYAVAALLVGRPSWRAGATGNVIASVGGILASLRRRPLVALPLVTLYGVMRFATGLRRWTVLALFALVAGGAAQLALARLEAEYRDAQIYLDPTAPTMPRVLLYVTGADIATSRFPLGAGFGRFGGYVATLEYSPLYDQYGLNRVWGLSPEAPYYLQDTYWPHIAAETGWCGAAILLALYLLLVERASRAALRAVDAATKAVAVGAVLAMLEGLIESLAGPVFEVALFAYAIAIPLGITLVRCAAPGPAEHAVPAPRPAPLLEAPP